MPIKCVCVFQLQRGQYTELVEEEQEQQEDDNHHQLGGILDGQYLWHNFVFNTTSPL